MHDTREGLRLLQAAFMLTVTHSLLSRAGEVLLMANQNECVVGAG